MFYEGTIIRPPSEADSIILQVTVGCSHNHCTFCGAYKDVRFHIKEDNLLEADLAFAARYCTRQNRVFLADGDALILPQRKLVGILEKVRRNLPWINRVSTYGNARAIRSKTISQLDASNYLPLAGRLQKDKGKILHAIDLALSGDISLVPESMRAL